MGRRRFIRTLAGLGISGTALGHLSKESLAQLTDNPEDEVPRLSVLKHTNHEAVVAGTESPRREGVFYTIPRDTWGYNISVNNASTSLTRKLQNKYSTDLVRATVGTTSSEREIIVEHVTLKKLIPESAESNETIYKTITPEVTPQELLDEVPATVSGQATYGGQTLVTEDIPVRVEQTEKIQQAYFDYEYRPVPAGCQIMRENDSRPVTMGAPCYDDSSGYAKLLTAGHCVNGTTGTEIGQPYDPYMGYSIGESNKAIVEDHFDAATVGYYGGDADTDYDVASDDGTYETMGWAILGVVGWDEIVDNVGNSNYELTLQGRTTGRNSGTIDNLQNSNKNIIINVDSDSGDSGGPHFKKEKDGFGNTDVYIAGIHAWGTGTDGMKAESTAMDGTDAIEDRMGVTL